MSDKPKRRWFRFHLLTLVFATLLCGGTLCSNLCYRHVSVSEVERHMKSCEEMHKEMSSDGGAVVGWPFIYYVESAIRRNNQPKYADSIPIAWMLNVLINLTVIALPVVFCESILRRREGRKP